MGPQDLTPEKEKTKLQPNRLSDWGGLGAAWGLCTLQVRMRSELGSEYHGTPEVARMVFLRSGGSPLKKDWSF